MTDETTSIPSQNDPVPPGQATGGEGGTPPEVTAATVQAPKAPEDLSPSGDPTSQAVDPADVVPGVPAPGGESAQGVASAPVDPSAPPTIPPATGAQDTPDPTVEGSPAPADQQSSLSSGQPGVSAAGVTSPGPVPPAVAGSPESTSTASSSDAPIPGPTPIPSPAPKVPPVRVDQYTRRSDDDAWEGHAVLVVDGDHEGQKGTFVKVAEYDESNGYPVQIVIKFRDATYDHEYATVAYDCVRPTGP